MAALNKLKLHWSPSAKRAIALSRKRRKMEEYIGACSISHDHANTRVEIKPAHHSMRYVPAVIDFVNVQVGPKHKGVLLRTIGILALRLVLFLRLYCMEITQLSGDLPLTSTRN
jgi:hypothetical protein